MIMIELNFKEYHLAEPFFKKKQYIPALSVIHGNYPGRVFVNDREPDLVIVWAIGRWMYLEGNINSEKEKTELNSFIYDVVIPECKQSNVNWFEIYASDIKCWDELFLDGLHLVKADKHYESVYTLNLDKFKRVKETFSPPIENIEVNLLEFEILPEEYRNLKYIDERFLTKSYPGIEIRKGHELITICRNNGFVYNNEYFIDVDTFVHEQRGKGYATLAAIKLIDHLLHNSMFPLWETTHQNTPSHKLATKLGFEVKEDYPVYAFINES